MKNFLITFIVFFALALAGITFANHAGAANGRFLASQKRTRQKPRPKALPPTAGISGGVRITAVSIEAAGESFGEEGEGNRIEAGENEEILIVRLHFKATPALRANSEVSFSKPELLLNEGQTGHTNLAAFTLIQNPNEPIDQEMDIPFVVPSGAEPAALMLGETVLDLTSIEITEPDPNASLPPSVRKIVEDVKRQDELRKILKQADEDQKRLERTLKSLKPIDIEKYKPMPTFTPIRIPDLLASPSPTPSPSPSPSP